MLHCISSEWNTPKNNLPLLWNIGTYSEKYGGKWRLLVRLSAGISDLVFLSVWSLFTLPTESTYTVGRKFALTDERASTWCLLPSLLCCLSLQLPRVLVTGLKGANVSAHTCKHLHSLSHSYKVAVSQFPQISKGQREGWFLTESCGARLGNSRAEYTDN